MSQIKIGVLQEAPQKSNFNIEKITNILLPSIPYFTFGAKDHPEILMG